MTTQVYLGIDVGKVAHYAVALTASGEPLFQQTCPNREEPMLALLARAQAIGPLQVTIDEAHTVGALLATLCHAQQVPVTYLPGRRMRMVAQTFPGADKTDPRDAMIIAEAGRSMPHTLQVLPPVPEVAAEVRMVLGRDADLATAETRVVARIRGLLTQTAPELEAVVGPVLRQAGVLALLGRYPTPDALRHLGPRRCTTFLARRGKRRAAVLATAITAAVTSQTVILPGTGALVHVLPQLVAEAELILAQRNDLAETIDQLLAAHPDTPHIRSMPGFGARLTARLIVELAGKTFASASALAAYAAIAPVTSQSGTSRHRTHGNRAGNRALKQACYLGAMASLRHDRRYYDRKRQEGKSHTQALICLARRRIDVLYAILRDRSMYQPSPPITP